MREQLQEWIMQYGYTALYSLLAVGIIGVPVPDEVLMTLVGYMTSIGILDYVPALIVSFAGSMTGMIISYSVGRKVGKPLLWRYGQWVKLTPSRLEKAESWFQKYGMWTVSFGYFVPGVRHFTCYLAGASHIRFWRYIAYAGSGAVVWCTTFITLGRVIGSNVEPLLHQLHRYVGTVVLLLIAVLAVAGFYYYRRRRTIS